MNNLSVPSAGRGVFSRATVSFWRVCESLPRGGQTSPGRGGAKAILTGRPPTSCPDFFTAAPAAAASPTKPKPRRSLSGRVLSALSPGKKK